MVMGLVFSTVLAQDRSTRPILMVLLGLLLSTIGTDLETGQSASPWHPEPVRRLDFTPLAMGIFGFLRKSCAISTAGSARRGAQRDRKLLPSWQKSSNGIPAVLRGTFIGGLLGISAR